MVSWSHIASRCDTAAFSGDEASAMTLLPITSATLPDDSKGFANSRNELKKRLALGEVAWTGPLLLVMARPFLFVLAQTARASVFALLHRPSAWRSAGAWWSVYGTHCALPLVPDWKYLAFRFVAFLPGVTLLTVIYLRIRRLPPMIVARWPMDLGAVIMTLRLPV